MPYKSRRPCAHMGCPELVPAGERYCANHKREAGRGGDNSHYDRRWRKIREIFLMAHPLCDECRRVGRLTPATEVHHIIAVQDGGSDADENLQALCKPCHSKKTLGLRNFG